MGKTLSLGGEWFSAVAPEVVNSALTVRSVESGLACVGDLPPALLGLSQFDPSYQVELARESGQVNRWSGLLKAGAVGLFVKVLEDRQQSFLAGESNQQSFRAEESNQHCLLAEKLKPARSHTKFRIKSRAW